MKSHQIFLMSMVLLAGNLPVLAEKIGAPEEAFLRSNMPGRIPLSRIVLSAATTGWGEVGINTTCDGKAIRVAGKEYKRGVGVHAPSEIPFLLNGTTTRFTATVGLSDDILTHPGKPLLARVQFSIVAHGKVLWTSRILAPKQSQDVNVILTGVRRLVLRVDTAGAKDYDHAVWADAMFTIRGKTPVCSLPDGICITRFGATANDRSNTSPAIKAALDHIRKLDRTDGKPIILRFPKGRYDFYLRGATVLEKSPHVSNNDDIAKNVMMDLRGLKNVIIDGEGSEFVAHGQMVFGLIENASNITVRDATFDYDTPVLAQGKIVKVDEKARTILLDIPRESPYFVRDGQLYFTGPEFINRTWTAGQFDAKTGNCAYINCWGCNGTYKEIAPGRVELHRPKGWLPIEGNYLVFRHQSARSHPGFFLHESKDILLENVTIHQAAAMGIIAQLTENITLFGVKVVPNAKKGRLFSVSADATHFSGVKGFLRVFHCEFSGQTDDAMNVHSTYTRIEKSIDAKTILVRFMHGQAKGLNLARKGDTMQFVHHTTMQPFGKRTVASVVRDYPHAMTITFTEALPKGIEAKDVVENMTWYPDVYFKNNRVLNNRARGILISTPGKVVIQSNYFRPHGSAILIAGDANGWFESGACKNVLIQRNTFDNCLTGLYQFTDAVVSIYPEVPKYEAGKYYHRNINIIENKFNVFDAPLLAARSTDGLSFVNNTVTLTTDYKPFHWNKNAFWLKHCKSVTIANNALDAKLLDKSVKLVGTDPAAVDISKQPDVKLAK